MEAFYMASGTQMRRTCIILAHRGTLDDTKEEIIFKSM